MLVALIRVRLFLYFCLLERSVPLGRGVLVLFPRQLGFPADLPLVRTGRSGHGHRVEYPRILAKDGYRRDLHAHEVKTPGQLYALAVLVDDGVAGGYPNEAGLGADAHAGATYVVVVDHDGRRIGRGHRLVGHHRRANGVGLRRKGIE